MTLLENVATRQSYSLILSNIQPIKYVFNVYKKKKLSTSYRYTQGSRHINNPNRPDIQETLHMRDGGHEINSINSYRSS